jgi:cyd operon protein YbgT
MWYFTWVLGLGLALTFSILNGLWHELHQANGSDDKSV